VLTERLEQEEFHYYKVPNLKKATPSMSLETTSGDLKPPLKLINFGGRILAFDNVAGGIALPR
jgi:hypothetical protein